MEKSCEPDILWNFDKGLPFPDDFVDEINLFHVIEHIQEKKHLPLLKEFFRVLKNNGSVYISYPEFVVCARNYINNVQGIRDFWKATIFGRQLYPSDYHVTLMDSRGFYNLLDDAGFKNIVITEESKEEPHNSICFALKGGRKFSYEDALRYHIWGIQQES